MRILGRDRLEASLKLVQSNHPDVRIVLIEPSRKEPLLFLHSPMSFEGRPQILEYGYESTLSDLETCGAEISDLLGADDPRNGPACTHSRSPVPQPATSVESPLAEDRAPIR